MSALFPYPRRAHLFVKKNVYEDNPKYLPPESRKGRPAFESQTLFNEYIADIREKKVRITGKVIYDEDVLILGITDFADGDEAGSLFLCEHEDGTCTEYDVSCVTFHKECTKSTVAATPAEDLAASVEEVLAEEDDGTHAIAPDDFDQLP